MPTKVITHCDTCGKALEKFPSLVRPHNFCDGACYSSWRKTLTRENSPSWKGGPRRLTCLHCGEVFVAPSGQHRTYCSVKCKVAAQRAAHICEQCGTVFPGARHRFCSYACSVDYRKAHPRVYSQQARAKIAAANIGHPGLVGAANPMFKSGWSARTTRPCPQCGKPFTAPTHQKCCSRQCGYAKQGERLRHFYHETSAGQELAARYRAEMKLLGNPDWEHKEYAPGFTKSLKRRVLHRDNHRCRICNSERIAKRWLAIHHIDSSKNNHDPNNLITLCKPCHMQVHRNNIDASVYLPD